MPIARNALIGQICLALCLGLGLAMTLACSPPTVDDPEVDGAGAEGPGPLANDLGQGLLVAVAALDKNADGSPQPLPARLGLLRQQGGTWRYDAVEDADSNVFHKAIYHPESGGVLTFGGTQAMVKLWQDGERQILWQEDFGGRFSRMRDAEIGDIYGDGQLAVAVATHDQGVVAVLRPSSDSPDSSGGFSVEQLDAQPDTIVHEIELGDLDGDGVIEIYATPTAPNKMDGSEQPGKVVRYVPATESGRTVVADLEERHAKEILLTDLDGDGRDELYVSVEAVSGGQVEIRRYVADTEPTEGVLVASLDDKLCRFLTAGDVDGDGKNELVAATFKSGLWLLRPADTADGPWQKTLIDSQSSGFEHASLLADLDEDGRDELYVASDRQRQLRRYTLEEGTWQHEVLWQHSDALSRFTWNLMPAPTALLNELSK